MENLKRLAIEDINKVMDKWKEDTNTEEGLKHVLQFFGKKYKGDVKAKTLKFLEQERNKRIEDIKNKIEAVNSAPDFTGQFIITVEWKKSRMWGMNPRAYTNYGFEGSFVSGCGYDKLSTATAEALNSNLSILKKLWLKKEDWINRNMINMPEDVKREYLGYGCGYGVLPKFEGGVGVDSHRRIIEGLNLNWLCVSNTDYTNVYLIS